MAPLLSADTIATKHQMLADLLAETPEPTFLTRLKAQIPSLDAGYFLQHEEHPGGVRGEDFVRWYVGHGHAGEEERGLLLEAFESAVTDRREQLQQESPPPGRIGDEGVEFSNDGAGGSVASSTAAAPSVSPDGGTAGRAVSSTTAASEEPRRSFVDSVFFDPEREAELALFYLESLSTQELWAQVCCISVSVLLREFVKKNLPLLLRYEAYFYERLVELLGEVRRIFEQMESDQQERGGQRGGTRNRGGGGAGSSSANSDLESAGSGGTPEMNSGSVVAPQLVPPMPSCSAASCGSPGRTDRSTVPDAIPPNLLTTHTPLPLPDLFVDLLKMIDDLDFSLNFARALEIILVSSSSASPGSGRGAPSSDSTNADLHRGLAFGHHSVARNRSAGSPIDNVDPTAPLGTGPPQLTAAEQKTVDNAQKIVLRVLKSPLNIADIRMEERATIEHCFTPLVGLSEVEPFVTEYIVENAGCRVYAEIREQYCRVAGSWTGK